MCLHDQRRERPLAAEGVTLRGREMFRQISSRIRFPRNSILYFTCRKSVTWDRRLYFPSEGRSAEDIFALKKPTASAGFEPANLGTKDQHATYRTIYRTVTSFTFRPNFKRPPPFLISFMATLSTSSESLPVCGFVVSTVPAGTFQNCPVSGGPSLGPTPTCIIRLS
jgi:hypothetical protein